MSSAETAAVCFRLLKPSGSMALETTMMDVEH